MKKLLMIATISLILGLMANTLFADPTFKFDYLHNDGTPDPNNSEGLLLREKTIKMDIYLSDWNPLVYPNVASIDYFFTFDPDKLDVMNVSFETADYWTLVPHDEIAPGVFFLGVMSSIPQGGIGVPGPDIFLHTVELRGIIVPQEDITIKATLLNPEGGDDGVISDVENNFYQGGYVSEAIGKIHSICKEHSVECSEDNPCNRWLGEEGCPDYITGPVSENSYELIPDPDETNFCRGDTIKVYHTYTASYEVQEEEVYDPDNACVSACFNQKFEDFMHGTITDCVYRCMEEEDSGYCPDLQDRCDIVHQEVVATTQTVAYCEEHYEEYQVGFQYWIEHCGLSFEDIEITVRVDTDDPDCEGEIKNDSPYPKLSGVGVGDIPVALPLDLTPGTYDICAEDDGQILWSDEVTVTSDGCPSSVCTIQIPYNTFRVEQGHTASLEGIVLETDVPGEYDISLEHTVVLPSSLVDPSSVNVSGNMATFSLDTNSNTYPEDGQNYWGNVRIRAECGGLSCFTTLDYVIDALSANEDCEWDDDFSLESTVYGGAARLGLDPPPAEYNVYVMKEGWDGVHLNSPQQQHQTTLTMDGNGDMACGSVIWDTKAFPYTGSLPANFDIVIDVNGNSEYHISDGDVIDSFMICLSSDLDGVCDDEDNCPNHPNGPLKGICTQHAGDNYIVSNGQYCVDDGDCDEGEYCEKEQADHYPPGGNGIGDACDCEGDFDCSGGVDAGDVGFFLDDWNKRTIYSNPCTNEDPCTGDFNCSRGVDAGDVGKFLEDWNKRTIYSNPCPQCSGLMWCIYNEE